MKQHKFSVSQLKKYNADPASWAGQYILWIWSFDANKNTLAGKMFEEYLTTKNVDRFMMENKEKHPEIFDDAYLLYENFVKNSDWLQMEVWQLQVKVEWDIAGHNFVGYIDNLTDERIEDIKTTSSAKNLESVSMFSWLSNGDEYELQLRVYMYLLWRDKARIIEVNGFQYQKPPKDWTRKIIEYHRTEEMDQKRLKFIETKCWEMQGLLDKFAYVNK